MTPSNFVPSINDGTDSFKGKTATDSKVAVIQHSLLKIINQIRQRGLFSDVQSNSIERFIWVWESSFPDVVFDKGV